MPLAIRYRIIVIYELEKMWNKKLWPNLKQCLSLAKEPILFPRCKLQVPRRLLQTLITRRDVINKALMFAQFHFGLLNVT
jgi:hypothetical protein